MRQRVAPAIHVASRATRPDVHQLRRLLRLEGELSELPAGSEAQRRHAIDTLGDLVGASLRLWMRVEGIAAGAPRLASPLASGFDSDGAARCFWDYISEGQERFPDPTLGGLPRGIASGKRVFLREHLVGDRVWYGADHVGEVRRATRVDSCIYTLQLDGDLRGAHTVTLHRPWGERPFDERDRALLEVFHLDSRQLRIAERGALPPPARAASPILDGLAPRLRQTLLALGRGLSEKQIAVELGISPYTVHDYVKQLHRRFRVQSRGELLARLAALH